MRVELGAPGVRIGCAPRGVVDLMTEFNLTQEAAIEVSNHCPVWAEFSAYEGGAAVTVAGRPQPGGR